MLRKAVKTEFIAPILRRHVFEFELLLDCAVAAAALLESAGRLRFEFLFTLGADIGSVGEAEKIFGLQFVIAIGLDFLRMRRERRKGEPQGRDDRKNANWKRHFCPFLITPWAKSKPSRIFMKGGKRGGKLIVAF